MLNFIWQDLSFPSWEISQPQHPGMVFTPRFLSGKWEGGEGVPFLNPETKVLTLDCTSEQNGAGGGGGGVKSADSVPTSRQ